MLGLILVFYLGKQFYKLAELYDKNKWMFALLGVVSYYLGFFFFGVLIGVWSIYIGNESIFETSDFVLGLMGIPFGLLTTWLFYFLLKKNWSKVEVEYLDSELLDNNI
jgi:hypothetical protein